VKSRKHSTRSYGTKFGTYLSRATMQHHCGVCGEPILFGEQYYHRRRIVWSKYQVLRWHMTCPEPQGRAEPPK
jgi:hypothetical protein